MDVKTEQVRKIEIVMNEDEYKSIALALFELFCNIHYANGMYTFDVLAYDTEKKVKELEKAVYELRKIFKNV